MENGRVENYPTDAYACWVDGREERGTDCTPLVDPSTGREYARVTVAGPEMVHRALEKARECFPAWKETPATERAQLLHALAEGVRRNLESLASLLSLEVGKPLKSSRDEAASAASLLDFFAEEATRLTGNIPLLNHSREHVLVLREPLGVAVAIMPYNYPLSTLVCKLGAALASGCTVVAKPDEHTPLTTLRMAQLAVECGIPAGVFHVVTGPGRQTGRLLVEHSTPRVVSFTGSTAVGREILQVSAKGIKKVILELGGHCPAIVLEDAPLDSILPQLLSQALKNSGQYCYRISRIHVAQSIYDRFLEGFKDLAKGLKLGPPSDPSTDLGPLNNAQILSGVSRQVEVAVSEGAKIEWKGTPFDGPDGGFYYPPTILTGLRGDMSITREEVFGPVVMVSPFSRLHEAITEANGSPFGLAAYVFSRDVGAALDCAGKLEVGSVWVNRIHQAYPQAPFGGVKESGLGREKSAYGLHEYTELKTVYLSY